MKKFYKFIIIILCLIAVGVTFYLISKMNSEIETKKQSSNQNQIENNLETEPKNIVEENQTAVENIVNEIENTITNENLSNETEEDDGDEFISIESSKNEAIRLVKEKWGQDSSVYFTNEENNGDIFVVAVRSKETTAVECYYNVNIKEKTVEIDI